MDSSKSICRKIEGEEEVVDSNVPSGGELS